MHEFPPVASVPASGTIETAKETRGENRTATGAPRPRSVSTCRARPVSGLVGLGLSPSRKRFACSGIVTDPRSPTVAGAAQAWAQQRAVPVSRFTRLQETLADTSNEWGDFTRYRQPAKSFGRKTGEHLRERILDKPACRCVSASNRRQCNLACSQWNRLAYSSWKEH